MRTSRRKRKKINITKYLISLLILLLIPLGVYFTLNNVKADSVTKDYIAHNHDYKKTEPEFKPFTTSMTLAAIGDILIHSIVYDDAKTSNGYDFKPMIANVKGLLENADLTIANQETIVGGTEIGLSTYPSFNSPFEVADAFKDAGVDIVSIANNHTLDRGEKAILSATNYLNKIGMEYTGGYQSPEDKSKIRVLNRNGISIAFLSYTYGTNGIPVPQGKDYLVNLIDMESIKKDIKAAKEEADVVSVSMHWGNEYQLYPNDYQKQLAQQLADEGVDIIIGHHPHVLQPMDWLTGKNGNQTFVVYSLGNFLSGQMWDYKDIGGVLQVEIVKEVKSKDETIIHVQNPKFAPTFVSNSHYKNFKVVPLQDANDFGLSNASSKYEEMTHHMNQWLDSKE
ncbi:CapA family protein [Fredinandcohnia sp. QZ13]|uniref:CapA family protein n=1 Tax=Fredinandcohnia sp. QZ13 TaxID=3073144 RepID=UPI00285355FC|nr:CapA family protein [Fredinandcohnia sp. QZ13]MDR4886375.1 CapA family protein [Fredinandcohnia sp. QZ13]